MLSDLAFLIVTVLPMVLFLGAIVYCTISDAVDNYKHDKEFKKYVKANRARKAAMIAQLQIIKNI